MRAPGHISHMPKQCPPSVFYIPSFISKQEEDAILAHIEHTPKPKWTQLSNRRLINYGGVPHKNGMIAEELPIWLNAQVNAVNNLGLCVHISIIFFNKLN